jgi:hypothetical protein
MEAKNWENKRRWKGKNLSGEDGFIGCFQTSGFVLDAVGAVGKFTFV